MTELTGNTDDNSNTSNEPTSMPSEAPEAALPLEAAPKRLRFAVDSGAMTEVPFWGNGNNRSNWAASIARDPMSPGGLHRRFWRVARSRDYYYMVDGHVGEPVEFGCNRKEKGSSRKVYKMFGVIVEITTQSIVIDKYATAVQAIKAATTKVAVPQSNHRRNTTWS